MKRFRSILRHKITDVYSRLSTAIRSDVPTESTVTMTPDPKPSEAPNARRPRWTKQSSFRSPLQLNGSSIVHIWFESVQETGVRFSLNMATGMLGDLENWTPDIEMPGGDAIDPEPLSVWGIDSADDRINIILHVDRFDDLYVDGIPTAMAAQSEVQAVISEITNVVVRDLWIEAFSAL